MYNDRLNKKVISLENVLQIDFSKSDQTTQKNIIDKLLQLYNYFENISPELKNDYKASRYVNTDFDKYDTQGERGEYMIIESRLQLHGYYEEERNCARTPYGAVIARCYLR
jgi:hypothetical protein